MALMNYREANQVLWRGCRPGHNGTQIEAENTIIDGTAVVYAVPLGAVGFITTIILDVKIVGVGSIALLHTDSVGAPLGYLARPQIFGAMNFVPMIITFWPPFELIDEEIIKIWSSALGLEAHCWLTGWHE